MQRYTATYSLLTMVPFAGILQGKGSFDFESAGPNPREDARQLLKTLPDCQPDTVLRIVAVTPLRDQVTRLSEPLPSRDTGLEQMAAKIDAWGMQWEWSRIVDGALVDGWNPGKQKGALAAVRAGHAVRLATAAGQGRPPAPPDLCVELSSKNGPMLRYLVSLLESSGEIFEKALAPCPCPFICPIFIYTGLRLSPEALDRLGDKIENRMLELIVLPDFLAAQLGDAWLAEAAIVLAADAFLDAARGRSIKQEAQA